MRVCRVGESGCGWKEDNNDDNYNNNNNDDNEKTRYREKDE